jgi:N-acetylglucosamine-6-phosphate deacetylase
MDAAFGSHSSQEDVQELARIQAEIGLTALLSSSVTEKFQSKEQELATHVEETRSN